MAAVAEAVIAAIEACGAVIAVAAEAVLAALRACDAVIAARGALHSAGALGLRLAAARPRRAGVHDAPAFSAWAPVLGSARGGQPLRTRPAFRVDGSPSRRRVLVGILRAGLACRPAGAAR